MDKHTKPLFWTLAAGVTAALAVSLMTTVTADDVPLAKPVDKASGVSSAAHVKDLKAARVERGKYLVMISACHDCHSPKSDAQMTLDESRLLSGRPETTVPPIQDPGQIRASLDLTAWAGPWGNSYAANLTPDAETGLGARYTEQLFIRTIRTGKKPEGEQLAPPMPWTVYRNMTDEDLTSIFAYLQTLKPVRNFVRASPKAAVAVP